LKIVGIAGCPFTEHSKYTGVAKLPADAILAKSSSEKTNTWCCARICGTGCEFWNTTGGLSNHSSTGRIISLEEKKID
jgi:hypothetical protein